MDIINLLLQQPSIDINAIATDHDHTFALFRACKTGNEEMVRAFMQIPKTNVNLQDRKGCTPLYTAAHSGHYDVTGDRFIYRLWALSNLAGIDHFYRKREALCIYIYVGGGM